MKQGSDGTASNRRRRVIDERKIITVTGQLELAATLNYHSADY